MDGLPDARLVGAYIRPPRAVLDADARFLDYLAPDTFGLEVRLGCIEETFARNNMAFPRALDLGGNCGFFSLSLMQKDLLGEVRVEDLDEPALEMGRAFSRALKLSSKAEFVRNEVTLKKVEAVTDKYDLVLCLNLIHHAGSTYDIEVVEELGWEAYALRWLAALADISETAVVGVGFKGGKPKSWMGSHRIGIDLRPRRFAQMCEQAGWKIVYDANVADLDRVGTDRANGSRRTYRGVARASLRWALNRLVSRTRRGLSAQDKKGRYHLYVLRRAIQA